MVGVLNVNKGYKKVAMAGMAGLGATLGMLVLTGKLFAAFPLAGIGGFVIEAPHLAGNTFSLTPSLTQTDQQQGWPAAMISLGDVTIDKGFQLEKHFDLTATPIGSVLPGADLSIRSTSLSGSGLLLDTTGLQATTAHFGTFDVHENYAVQSGTTEQGVEGSIQIGNGIDPAKQLGLSAANLDLTGAAINTDALKTSSLNLNGLKLQITGSATGITTASPSGAFKYDTYYDTFNPLDSNY